MKPLKLTLRGINSYRTEQVIDFEQLTSSGLFGIFGPTGSGKSSILDAITLALYARLPRSTKNFININEKTAAISFLFSITTTETHRYQVERSFRYHGEGEKATVRNISGRLLDVTGDSPVVMADRPTEVTQECVRLLGLTSDDFMRTVVLPQGQFSEFLKLKNQDRRNMLQRIFHLEKYGLELTQKIASARQKQDLLLSNLEGQLNVFKDVTEEKLELLTSQWHNASEKTRQLSKKMQEEEISFKKAQELRDLLKEYIPLKKTYEEALLQLPAMEEKERKLEISKKANQIRPFADQAQKASRDYEQSLASLHEAKDSLSAFLSHYEQLTKELDQIRKEYADQFPSFVAEEGKLQSAIHQKESITAWTKNKNALEKELETQKTLLDTYSEKQKQFLSKASFCREEIRRLEANGELLKSQPGEIRALEKGHTLEETYREKRRVYEISNKRFAEKQNKHKADQGKLEELCLQLASLMAIATLRLQELNDARNKIETSQKQLQQQSETLSRQIDELRTRNLAAFLQSQLKPGEPCPVCGSIHHSSEPQSAQLKNEETHHEALLKKWQEQLDQLETDEKNMLLECNRLDQQISLIETTILLLPSFQKESFCPALPDSLVSESSFQTLSNDEIRLRIQKTVSEYSSLRGSFLDRAENILEEKQHLTEEYKLLQNSGQDILNLRRQWQVENFTKALEEKQKQEEEYEKIQTRIKNLRGEAEENEAQNQKISETIMTLSQKISSLETDISSHSTFIQEQWNKFPADLPKDADYSLLLSRVQTKKALLEEKKAKLEEQYQKDSTLLLQKKEKVSAADSREKSCGSFQTETAERLQTELEKHGFSPDTDLSSLYLSEEEIRKMSSQLEEFNQMMTQTKERLQYLDAKRQNRSMTDDEWRTIRERYEKTTQLFEEQRKEEMLLGHQADNCKNQLLQKEALLKEQTAAIHKRGLIRQLEQLFKGNAFVEYVAQSRLKYIASEASSILSSISNGNYALEVNDATEFMIRDNKNGGILRPCDTLSGGETFITSLSLALALSSVIQLNGTAPLELFFLDEGFGSLDDELLDVVMTSLERLPNKRRSIGIISHVEAIQARVPVKLIITPSDISQNGSSIQLVYS